jgi:hypothetical protein
MRQTFVQYIFQRFAVGEVLAFNAPAGTKSPSVADGYWLMLHPLSVGRQTLNSAVRSMKTGLHQHEVHRHCVALSLATMTLGHSSITDRRRRMSRFANIKTQIGAKW